MHLAALVGVALVLNTSPIQAQKADTPRFEDYPVTEMFTGMPAAPILATPEQRMYRTRIRNGVLKGEGVVADSESLKPLTKPGTNFAGLRFHNSVIP